MGFFRKALLVGGLGVVVQWRQCECFMMGGLQRTGRGVLSQSNSRTYAKKPGPEGDHSGERILGQRAGGRGKGKNGSRNPGRGGPKRRTQPDVRLGPRRGDSLESPEREIEGKTGLERLDEESLLSLFQEFGKESLSETTLDSTVRVYCTHVQPSCTAPWQRLPQIGSTSSGFIIEGRRIITNAHSVEYASIIQVRKRGCDVKWVAELLHYGMECDLAVLTVRDEKFWEDLHPIEFGPLPQLMDEVSVVGYPIGGESLSVTAGVVSRIELQEYAQGGETLLAIQIDAAINSGNSGGPVINEKDQLVGVAFQTLASHDAENIGYVIPVDILQHFLDDVERHGSYTGFCSLGVKFQPMESPVLRRYKQVPQGESGVLITKIDPLAPSHEVLQRGDVLLGVDGVSLANDGSIPFRKGERVELHYYFSQMFKGDSVNLRILRDGQVIEVRSQLYLHKPAVRSHLKNQLPKYLMVGGLVFTVLSHPFLAAALGESYGPETLADVRLLYLAQSNLKDPNHELVVLCELLENEINLGYELFGRQHLIAFNGVPVENLAHLAQMVDATTEGQMIFELDRDGLIVLDAERAHQATREIAVMHGIPVDRSVDLLEGQEGVDGL